MERAYAATGEDVLCFFNVDDQTGLGASEVTTAQAKYGKNCELPTFCRDTVRFSGPMVMDRVADVISLQPYQKSLPHRYGSLSSSSSRTSWSSSFSSPPQSLSSSQY